MTTIRPQHDEAAAVHSQTSPNAGSGCHPAAPWGQGPEPLRRHIGTGVRGTDRGEIEVAELAASTRVRVVDGVESESDGLVAVETFALAAEVSEACLAKCVAEYGAGCPAELGDEVVVV
jgi:hypothetical protein